MLIPGEPGSLVGPHVEACGTPWHPPGCGWCDSGTDPAMHDSSPSPISISRLEKTFGHTQALAGLDLHVHAGEVHGFLGPNGAEKSTTLRILLGLVRPSSGTVRVFGTDPWAEPVRTHRDIAYVPGDVTLWPNLTGGEVIDLLAGLRGGADERLRRELIEEFDFDPSGCRT